MRNLLYLYFILLFMVAYISVFDIIGSNIISSSFVLYLSLFFSIVFCVFIYRESKVTFFLLMQFIILFIWNCFSLFYIESNNYISEQDITGNNIGSLSRYVFYYSTFLLSSCLCIIYGLRYIKIDCVKNKYTCSRNLDFSIFFVKIFFAVILLVSIFIGIMYGFPFLSGNTRFEFYRNIAPFNRVIFLMPILAFFVGVIFSLTNNKFSLIPLPIIVVLLILFSDKFSGIFGVFVYYLIGYYISCNVLNILNKRGQIGFGRKVLFLYFPLVFLLLFCIVVVGFFILHNNVTVDNIQEKLLSRALGLQAHVWYGVDFRLYENHIQYNPSIFFLENNEPQQPAGLIYLMYQIADFNFVRLLREEGVRFTNGYPAIILISFGYFYSFWVLLFLGIMLGLFLLYIYIKLVKLQPIRLLISLIFYNNIIVNIFIMGEVYYIYKILTISCLVIIFIDVFLFKHKDVKL